ncbi:phosphohexomutase domain-containing protein [Methylotetracoccus oryzae]|uniref:phosphomannomutase n=1 Tax=Methylotetracoccus oryzae TaxID=1919059 RepID=UPI00111A3B2F|nr:phosphomannomutase [Methylotetracoccus oryzae]
MAPLPPNDTPLGTCLVRKPVALQFGTSGRRGLLLDLTQLEVFLNALAELEYLQSLPPQDGGIVRGDVFYFAHDLRPSSSRFVDLPPRRGELAQAIEYAIRTAGMKPINLGCIPTPALMLHAMTRGKGSIMVTGSHIPFDRNGYKLNTAVGELLKQHEGPINEHVLEVRQRLYEQPFDASPFDEQGMLKSGSSALSQARDDAALAYLARYTQFFGDSALRGLRLLVYQHSAVGRDLLPEILRSVGAEVVCAGRSETFVPIDTENIGAAELAAVQTLFDEAVAEYGAFDAVVSTDGDSDRPLILGVEPGTQTLRFFGGDLVGMVTAEYLGADAAVVPISCNDAIDRGRLKSITEPKTRIGSPFVIAGMERARAQGKSAVCGWEANGGFLTGTDFVRDGRVLAALPTRDSVLPMLAVLSASRAAGMALTELFGQLPARFSRAALLKDFPRPVGLEIVRRLSPVDPAVAELGFADGSPAARSAGGARYPLDEAAADRATAIRQDLTHFFTPGLGFAPISALSFVDGVRIFFLNGEVAHLRPSGNADELRIYAVADTQARADAIVAAAIAEPGGILRQLERWAR